MSEEEKSKIDRLKDALYSRKVKIKPSFVLDLHGHKTVVPEKWQEKEESPKTDDSEPRRSLSQKLFLAASVFFVLCLGVAFYVYFVGSNLISSNNIKVDILGPSAIKAGEVTALDFTVTNNNDTTLEIADLVIEFPQGTRSATDQITPLNHNRVPLGTIRPHETVRKTVSAVLYGEEGKSVTVPVSIQYHLPNSTSTFEKNLSYEGLVGSSPITVSVSALKEVNAEQDYTLKINVVSNSRSIERGIILTGEMPTGFDVVSVTPNPIVNQNGSITWNLGDIEAGGSRDLVIVGKVYGDKNEQRYFKFNAGVAGSTNPNVISASISKVTHTVDIKQPFIGVALLLDKKEADGYIARSGADITSQIVWQNNLSVPIYDMTIDAAVTGDIVNSDTIKSPVGFYDSNKGVVRWNKGYNKNLQSINPGQNGTEEFSMNLWPAGVPESASIINPEFTVDITVHAKRRLENGVPEDIVSTVQKKVKVASSARFVATALHSIGPIENTGDLPPHVGQKTTYTIVWAVTNTANKLSDAKVVATIPDYISWENVVTPSSENITYNPSQHQITWNLGDVGTGSSKGPMVRQVAFQIGLVPSASQTQTPPVLIDIANFSANDTFTLLKVTDQANALDTKISSDPSFNFGDEQVRQ